MNALTAKNLLLPIPEEDFITNIFTDFDGKCCVIGHLVRLESEDPSDYTTRNCSDLSGKPHPVRALTSSFGFCIARVNDNTYPEYNQDSPKKRVIALLDDMIDAGL